MITSKCNGLSRLGILALLGMAAVTSPALANGDAADEAMDTIHPEAIRADMRFLSDDALEGRGTATRGFDIAAKYMGSQFESLGLKPAGDAGTYFQDVPLRSYKADQTKSVLTLIRGSKEETLTSLTDYYSIADAARTQSSIEAPVVFVGDGVTAPELGYDDYKGVDVRGKIVAMTPGAPDFESSLKAHYSAGAVKARNAVAHGAAGVIIVADPIFEQMYSFKTQVRDLASPRFRWLDKEHRPYDYFPELKCVDFLSLEESRKFFAGSPHTLEEILASTKAGKPMSFAMPLTARMSTTSELQDVHSRNVIARLEGSDPILKGECLVYSAHLDHLGIGQAVKGDAIYNGALDNASGSAILIEVARAFSNMKTKPRRSILFLSVTGEEAGLLGSDFFAHYPTVAKDSIVANVNMDEDLMLWPLQDIVAFGAEHSTLDVPVKKAAAHMHLVESPDPAPEEVVFIRSDQYSFVKQGIPAVFPSAGIKSDDPKIDPVAIFKNWEQTRYHQPQDDMEQPGLDFEAAAKYARFVFLCGYYIAEDSQRPAWNKGDFFGRLYGHASN
jgi:hypothetical protein